MMIHKIIPSRVAKIGLSCMVALLCSVAMRSQDASLDAIQQQFDSYRQATLQEKVFLHTDKNFYLAGEICWFKLYNVDAFFNKPISVSKVGYVEVLDKNNKAVLQAKIGLKEGDGNGSLQLPVTLSSGMYKIRAYTNWMKNFNSGYFFEKTLTVINPRKIYEPDTVLKKTEYDIQFFPEGGNLVNGIESKVAFKVTDQYGKGVTCWGGIISDKSDTLVHFSTLSFGMGNFLFTPENGRTYKAFIQLPDGRRTSRDLPIAYGAGYVMRLNDEPGEQIKITVRAPANNAAGSPAVYLFAHTRGAIKIAATAYVQNGLATFTVEKSKLGDGISHFTVFNADRRAMCERLYFKYPQQRLQVGVTSDLQEYELRKKISLHITSGNELNQPIAANMSMAVFRVDSLQKPEETDISSYLWFSSDLAGGVESPGYYFNNNDSTTLEAMDNLLLTQGWRRFRWEDIQQNKKPMFEFMPEYKGHIVSGKIVKTSSGAPAPSIGSFLSVPGTRTQFRTAISDSRGQVKFDMDEFYNNGEIIVQTGIEDSTYNVELISPFSDKPSTTPLPAFSLPYANAATLINQNIGVQVQNVYAGNKLKQFRLPAVDTSAFYSTPDISYLLDNYVRFTTLEEVLREYVMPVGVRRRGTKYHLPVFDDLRRQFFETDPLLLLDGVPVFDFDKFMKYDPLKIKRMDVMSRTYFLGNMFFQGVINCFTYNGDLSGFELDPHATVIDYEGLQLQRDFYAPSYETTQLAGSRLPDYRNLLFWSPNVTTDEKGRKELSFYSSDLPGKYAVVLQGITANGKTGSKVIMLNIKEPASFTSK